MTVALPLLGSGLFVPFLMLIQHPEIMTHIHMHICAKEKWEPNNVGAAEARYPFFWEVFWSARDRENRANLNCQMWLGSIVWSGLANGWQSKGKQEEGWEWGSEGVSQGEKAGEKPWCAELIRAGLLNWTWSLGILWQSQYISTPSCWKYSNVTFLHIQYTHTHSYIYKITYVLSGGYAYSFQIIKHTRIHSVIRLHGFPLNSWQWERQFGRHWEEVWGGGTQLGSKLAQQSSVLHPSMLTEQRQNVCAAFSFWQICHTNWHPIKFCHLNLLCFRWTHNNLSSFNTVFIDKKWLDGVLLVWRRLHSQKNIYRTAVFLFSRVLFLCTPTNVSQTGFALFSSRRLKLLILLNHVFFFQQSKEEQSDWQCLLSDFSN